MEYGQIFHVMRIGKYYCKNMKYCGTLLIRTSLNRNLANLNGKALVNFFFFFFVVAILTYFFLYSDGACPSSTPSLAADSTFLTCMNKDVSIHAKLSLTI